MSDTEHCPSSNWAIFVIFFFVPPLFYYFLFFPHSRAGEEEPQSPRRMSKRRVLSQEQRSGTETSPRSAELRRRGKPGMRGRSRTGRAFRDWILTPRRCLQPSPPLPSAAAGRGRERAGDISEGLPLFPRKASPGRQPLSRSITKRGNHPPIEFTKARSGGKR